MATLAQNIQRAINDFNSIENAIVQKGVPVPDGTPTSEYGEKILSIETGVDTSGDTVVPSALREGYTAHNAAGQAITGTIPNYDGSITEGAVEGAQAKYEEGVADGKQEQYDAFWDAFQENGARTNYSYAFAHGWDNESFFPKHNISPTSADHMFDGSEINGDMVSLMEERDIEIDFSKARNISFCFAECKITRAPYIDASSATTINAAFFACYYLKEATIRLSNATIVNLFSSCSSLSKLLIEDTIGQSGFNVSWSPLSKASIISVINALSSTTTGLTVTLRLAAVDTAFETAQGSADGSSSEEWMNLIATKSNWTINLINS